MDSPSSDKQQAPTAAASNKQQASSAPASTTLRAQRQPPKGTYVPHLRLSDDRKSYFAFAEGDRVVVTRKSDSTKSKPTGQGTSPGAQFFAKVIRANVGEVHLEGWFRQGVLVPKPSVSSRVICTFDDLVGDIPSLPSTDGFLEPLEFPPKFLPVDGIKSLSDKWDIQHYRELEMKQKTKFEKK